MLKLLLLLLLITSGGIIAQKTNIKTLPGGFVLKNNIANIYGITVQKDLENHDFLFAVRKNYATKVFKVDSILQHNQSVYIIKQDLIQPIDKNLVLKKIIFRGFNDENSHIHFNEFLDKYTQVSYTIKSSKFDNSVRIKLSENNFKIKTDEELFEQKFLDANYTFFGDILFYKSNLSVIMGSVTSIVIKWTFYDLINRKEVLEITTGGYSSHKSKLLESELLKLAIEDALGGIIINKELQQLLSSTKNDIKKDNFNNTIINQYSENTSISLNVFEKAKQTVLKLKSGNENGIGFIISNDGYVLTSNSNIENENDIDFEFINGLILPAKVISKNKDLNIALCKIEGIGYKPCIIDTNKNEINIKKAQYLNFNQSTIELNKFDTINIDGFDSKNFHSGIKFNPNQNGNMILNENGEIIGLLNNLNENASLILSINEVIKSLKLNVLNKE